MFGSLLDKDNTICGTYLAIGDNCIELKNLEHTDCQFKHILTDSAIRIYEDAFMVGSVRFASAFVDKGPVNYQNMFALK